MHIEPEKVEKSILRLHASGHVFLQSTPHIPHLKPKPAKKHNKKFKLLEGIEDRGTVPASFLHEFSYEVIKS